MEASSVSTIGPDEYIRERVDKYITSCDQNAVKLKSYYLTMRALSVVGGAIVPVLVNLPIHAPYKDYLTTMMSLVVVSMVALESVYHHREQWKNLRSAEQFIAGEKYRFRTSQGPYRKLDPKDAFLLFVQRIEDAIAAENVATLNTMTLDAEVKESRKTRGDK